MDANRNRRGVTWQIRLSQVSSEQYGLHILCQGHVGNRKLLNNMSLR
ncbi:MAG: hypothetical protein RLZZ458_1374 [Planctomycetota bacterium]